MPQKVNGYILFIDNLLFFKKGKIYAIMGKKTMLLWIINLHAKLDIIILGKKVNYESVVDSTECKVHPYESGGTLFRKIDNRHIAWGCRD